MPAISGNTYTGTDLAKDPESFDYELSVDVKNPKTGKVTTTTYKGTMERSHHTATGKSGAWHDPHTTGVGIQMAGSRLIIASPSSTGSSSVSGPSSSATSTTSAGEAVVY